jgi:rhamnosyltransferase
MSAWPLNDGGWQDGTGRDVHRVVAIVVTFNPDLATFAALLAATHAQADHILVVDNGSRAECTTQLARLCEGRATLHLLQTNAGIAAAQNHGIVLARNAGGTDVLLLDHDSVPSPGMIAALLAASEQLRAMGEAVGAVGPLVVDRATQTVAPLPQIVDGRVQFHLPTEDSITRCEYLIASGSLIPMQAVDSVGLMDEAFFVDQVDVDWCLRAGAAGYGVYCTSSAQLQHAIGDEVVHFWMFGQRELAVHAPMRDYFYFRNSLRLMFSSHTAPAWRRFWVRRLLRLFVLQPLFVPPRWQRLRAMVSGVWAALAERCRSRSMC